MSSLVLKDNQLFPYSWLVFDADETLFSYPSYLGLKQILQHYSVEFNEVDYREFQNKNAVLWQQLQQGKISMQDLAVKRFAHLAKQAKVNPLLLNHQLQIAMAKISQPFDGAKEILQKAKDNGIGVAIITNGFTALQKPRLVHHQLIHLIDVLCISEEIGFAKPHPQIFQAALTKMGNPDVEQVLMIGDNLESDIKGAQSVRMKTCWINRYQQENHSTIQSDFTVYNLHQLNQLLFAH